MSLVKLSNKIRFVCLFVFLSVISNAQNLYINEFMASNVTAVPEIVDFEAYSDWIEIYNDSDFSIDLSGYGLTDNLGEPFKWRIPNETTIEAKGFLTFWADGYDTIPGNDVKYYHTNFNLSKDGEEIGLFSPEGNLVDSIIFGPQVSDVSFGRDNNGDTNWVYFGEPTFNRSNITIGINNLEISVVPNISLESGFYSASQNVTITANSPNSVITYTLDGSNPIRTSTMYSQPIIINKNTILRVREFEEDKLPSKMATRSYFVGQVQNLPVLSLTVYPETFFGNDIGIYDNEIKSREVPITAEYFEEDGKLGFRTNGGARISGQASYLFGQKSLTIETDDKYGNESINYPIFNDRPFENYKSIYLRNSGTNDYYHTHFRDAMQHSLVINQIDVDCQAYQPVAAFINGEYWGIYNMREKLDENYLISHHGVDPNNLDYLEYEFSAQPNVLEGNTDAYFALIDFLERNSMNDPESWEYVASQIDLNETMNLLITELYCDNINWPYTNSRFYKERSADSKLRHIFHDSDFGFGAPSWDSRVENPTLTNFYYGYPFAAYPFATYLFRKLLENRDFKNEFIQRYATYLNTIFKTERVVGVIDSIKNMINTEMTNHIDRWNSYSPGIPNVSTWNDEVEIMRDFGERRNEYVTEDLLEFYKISGTEQIKFTKSNSTFGKIYVTNYEVEELEGEYFRYIPIKIKAVPNVGYKFIKWSGVKDSLSSETTFTPIRSDSTIIITAIFEEDNVSLLSSEINENTTLSFINSPYYATGNVKVKSGVILSVESGVEILMTGESNIIVNGSLQMVGTEEQPIKIKPNNISGFENWGYIFIDSASATSSIKYVNIYGATQNVKDSSQLGAISSYKSDLVIENVSIQDAPFPIFIQFGNVEIRNCSLHTEKVSDLINVKYAESAIVENCDLRGNNQFDTDAIDYDNISNGIIRNNKVYNFYGFNSDGIDLGEGAKGILVEQNLILNCNDKGISVGQSSTTLIKNNIIINCGQGVGIKDDSSYAFIDKNTFYGCNYGVASFEKNIGAGGGNAEIENSIFSNSKTSPTFVDELSILTASYSLSDTKNLDGVENIKANPLFINNFRLAENSPAINSGNPAKQDPDGSRADIGAKYYDGKYEPIIFNEINYNADGTPETEFIELYNTSDEPINLSGYKIKGAIDYTFETGIIIEANDYLVLVTDIPTCCDSNILFWGEPELPNDWGNLSLIDNLGNEVDFVSYSNSFGWPESANGEGHTLELRSPQYENLVTENWQASGQINGSPNQPNIINYEGVLFVNELQADNETTIKDENNEFDDWIEIYNSSENKINLGGLYVTDDFSDLTKFRIPSSEEETIMVGGKGYQLLWADGSIDQGSNHLDLKLSKDGEELALVYVFDNDTTIIDSVTFGNQEADYSYARNYDSSDDWSIQVPTPQRANSNNGLFKNGILLVNGLNFSIDDAEEAYLNKAFWGNHKIEFWDIYPEPTNGYPESLPEPKGYGFIPLDTLTNYSTVIWTGENISTDINYWKNTESLEYLKMGGNFLLLLKNAKDYLDDEAVERLGITWLEPYLSNINNCLPTDEELDTINVDIRQYQSSIFDTAFTHEYSKLLYVDTETYNKPVGIGMYHMPKVGGMYNINGGKTVLISGRPYRYNYSEMKENMSYILSEYFNETNFVDVEYDNLYPNSFALSQNYPNPFNPSTKIKYSVPQLDEVVKLKNVTLKIYDILGQEVTTLVDEMQRPGFYEIEWNASNIASGIYFYRIQSGKWSDIKKMILLK